MGIQIDELLVSKGLEDYPGYYVSPEGKVFKVVELSSGVNSSGYKYVKIQKGNRKGVVLLVHRLVAKHFVEGFEEGLTVDHLNKNKSDNNWLNLQWVSLKTNIRRAFEKERTFIHEDGTVQTCKNLREFSDKFDLDPSSVTKVTKGKMSHTKGWRIFLGDTD